MADSRTGTGNKYHNTEKLGSTPTNNKWGMEKGHSSPLRELPMINNRIIWETK